MSLIPTPRSRKEFTKTGLVKNISVAIAGIAKPFLLLQKNLPLGDNLGAIQELAKQDRELRTQPGLPVMMELAECHCHIHKAGKATAWITEH